MPLFRLNLCYDYQKSFNLLVERNESTVWGPWLDEVRTYLMRNEHVSEQSEKIKLY